MKYVHLTAMVNGALKDVLVNAELYKEALQEKGADPAADFFVATAQDITIRKVEIEAAHELPDVFGE